MVMCNLSVSISVCNVSICKVPIARCYMIVCNIHLLAGLELVLLDELELLDKPELVDELKLVLEVVPLLLSAKPHPPVSVLSSPCLLLLPVLRLVRPGLYLRNSTRCSYLRFVKKVRHPMAAENASGPNESLNIDRGCLNRWVALCRLNRPTSRLVPTKAGGTDSRPCTVPMNSSIGSMWTVRLRELLALQYTRPTSVLRIATEVRQCSVNLPWLIAVDR